MKELDQEALALAIQKIATLETELCRAQELKAQAEDSASRAIAAMARLGTQLDLASARVADYQREVERRDEIISGETQRAKDAEDRERAVIRALVAAKSDALKAVAEEREACAGIVVEMLRLWRAGDPEATWQECERRVRARSSAPETKAAPRATEADFEALRRVQQNSERLRADDVALREELGLQAAPIPPIGIPGRWRARQKDPAYRALVQKKEREIEAEDAQAATVFSNKKLMAVFKEFLAQAATVEPTKELHERDDCEDLPPHSACTPEPRPNEAERLKPKTVWECAAHGGFVSPSCSRCADDLRSRLAQVEAEREELAGMVERDGKYISKVEAERDEARAEIKRMREADIAKEGEAVEAYRRLLAERDELRKALGPDLSGRDLADLLSEAAEACFVAGGGPLEDCLRHKAEQIRAALSKATPPRPGGER